MKILYITNARIPTEKAHGLQIMKTLEALARAGAVVSLVIPKRKNSITQDPFVFYGVRVHFPVVFLARFLGPLESIAESLYFPLLRVVFGIQAFFYGAFVTADVVYTRDLILAFFLSLFSRKEVVYEDHEPKKSLRGFYFFFLRHVKKKVVVAENLSALYKQHGVRNFEYIPNGVDLEEFTRVSPDPALWEREFGISPGTPIALYVGHLYSWKGVYTVLRVAKELPQTAFVFIGGTRHDQALFRHKAMVQTNVYVRDFMPHKEVIRYMKSADCVLLPNTAQEERSNYYTTPLKLFEYMASRVPIVASRIPSFTPYLRSGENSLLVMPDDAAALARGIEEVLSSQKMGERFAEEAWGDVQACTWTARAEKIVTLLQR